MVRVIPDACCAWIRKRSRRFGTRELSFSRGHLDHWSANLLSAAGAQLGRDASNARTAECFPSKAFFEIVDGRITWQRRDQMDRHVVKCWHCVDHFCRCLEVIDLGRDAQPLSEEQALPFNRALGIRIEKPPHLEASVRAVVHNGLIHPSARRSSNCSKSVPRDKGQELERGSLRPLFPSPPTD